MRRHQTDNGQTMALGLCPVRGRQETEDHAAAGGPALKKLFVPAMPNGKRHRASDSLLPKLSSLLVGDAECVGSGNGTPDPHQPTLILVIQAF